jgi:membrane fusion protein, multidrug efflux system
MYAAVALPVVAALAIWLARRAGPETAPDETAPPRVVAVKVGRVVRATLRAYVTGFGTVEPEPAISRQPPAGAKIGSPVPGLLAESRAVEGQQVEKGAALFQLDSRVADVQVEKARQAMEFAERALDRQKTLLAVEGTSQRLYQEADAQAQAARYELANAQALRALLTIRAPISGTVTRVFARPGDAVDLTTVLAEMVDLSRLVVSARIRSVDVPVLRREQPAEVSIGRPEAPETATPAAPPVAATVSFIGSAVDPATDTVQVRASLPPQAHLRPGQFVTARIRYAEHRDCLAVPVDSVVRDDTGHAFVALVEDGTAVRHPVTLGITDDGLVEVEGPGLADGAAIVASGAYGLPDHTRVRPTGP